MCPSRLFQVASTKFFEMQPPFRKFEFGEFASHKAFKKGTLPDVECLFRHQIKGTGLYVCAVFQSASTHFCFPGDLWV